jgi:hypothetical protein
VRVTLDVVALMTTIAAAATTGFGILDKRQSDAWFRGALDNASERLEHVHGVSMASVNSTVDRLGSVIEEITRNQRGG